MSGRHPDAGATAVAPAMRDGLRGLVIGALLVTFFSAAVAAQSLHLGFPLLDWIAGVALVSGPLVALVLVLRVPTAVAAWLLRRLARGATGRGRRATDAVVAVLGFVGSPFVAVAVGIAVLVWKTADGPLGMFHFLFFFEILIVAGAIVGFLIGVGLSLRRAVATSTRPRRLGFAMALAGVLVGTGIGGWAIMPGSGGQLVWEAPAAVAAVPELDLVDPSAPGPYSVKASSYGSGLDARRPEFGANAGWTSPTVDASIALPERTDIGATYARWFWGFDATRLPLNALVWYPTDAPGRLPVALIVHGNHDAGDYSDPGYAYLGEHLASRGIVLVSIDENFLNGDPFYDYAGAEMGVRGWFLLEHLDLLRTWDASAGHPLAGRLDLDRVALIGHSRGGEAAAVAAMLNQTDGAEIRGLPAPARNFGIRAVVGIAPSVGMYRDAGSSLTLGDLDYLVIQGAHDGDLPGFDGMKQYHRVEPGEAGDHLKVALYSERANHGRFNTVWDYGDAGSLMSWMLDRGSMFTPAEQQRFAKAVIGAFLARSLQGETGYDAFFRDPRAGRSWLPDDVVETHWETSGRVVVEDFSSGRIDADRHPVAGFESVMSVDPPTRDGATQRDRATRLTWTGEARYEIAVGPPIAAAVDPAGSLVFAMTPCDDGAAVAADPLVELRLRNGQAAAVRLSDVAPTRPLLPTRIWKIAALNDRYLPTEQRVIPAERFLQTYEIELSEFARVLPDFDPDEIVGLTFRFDGSGSVFLDDIAFEPPVD